MIKKSIPISCAIFIFTVIVLFILLIFPPLSPAKAENEKTQIFVGASSNNFPPMNLLDRNENLTGFGRELTDAVMKAIDAKVTHIHSSSWVEVLKWLDSGKADFIHDCGYTKDRDKFLDYSKPIIEMPERIFVRSNQYDITGFDSLKGKKVACVNKHISHLYLQTFPEITCYIVKTPAEGLYELISGKVDAFVYPKQIVLYLAQKLRLTDKIKTTGDPLRTLTWSMVVKKGNKEILTLLNEGIDKIRETGEYSRIYNKWWGKKILSGYTKRELHIIIFISIGLSICIVSLIALLFYNYKLRMGRIRLKKEIIDRKKAENTLRDSQAKFSSIYNESPIGIELYNSEGILLDVNPKCLEIFGVRNIEAVKGFKLFEDPNISDDFKKKLRIGEQVRFESEFDFEKIKKLSLYETNKTGKSFIEVFITPWETASLDKKSFLVHVIDITERKQAQKEKIKAQKITREQKKLALVGQIAGKMAHDFNNILGIIMGNTELSLLDCKDNETRKTLKLIFEQTVRGKNLTKNLVAFAKDQEPKQVFFRISEKIDLVINLMKKDLEGIELLKEESPGIPELLADPGMIEHALVNLIQNSIHAISMVEHPRIIIKTYSLDNNICFEIEDNGCGISKEHLEYIYEPSFTLKGSKDVTYSYKTGIHGTGYGMANVKKYIEQHKGIISVESEISSGTKFTISLPVIKKELTSEEIVEIRKEIAHFEKYILLVEDEIDISNIQYRVLTNEPCNHKVDIANTGQIAMDLFDRTEYDFISLDYVLPGGINGMDVYHYIRETDKSIPILFVSGNIEFLESIKELKQKDVNIDHISKPCQNKEYVSSINKLLGKTSIGQ